MIRSRAPVRISLGGGGTDISPYKDEHGGIVLSTTIDHYTYCTVKKSDVSIYQSQFARAAKRFLNRRGKVSIMHFSEAPAGSGLGGSSTLMVAILKALGEYHNVKLSLHELAEAAYHIERDLLGMKGGWQDQFAAAYGGWNLMEFSRKHTKIVRLNIAEDTLRELLASLILVDLGKSHFSPDLIERQIASFKRPEVLANLERMKDITRQMVVRILAGDVSELGSLLTQEWDLKKTLDKKISNATIDGFHAGMLKRGAVGGKLLGAGNWGHMVFISDISKREGLLKYVESTGFHSVPFKFDSQGVVAWTV